MPGDEWRQFANVRCFLAFMWTHPGKKLLFMGQEIGQREEWNHNTGLRWELLEFAPHRKLQALARELNRLYRENPALYQVDFHHTGFEWVDFHDSENSVISFLRLNTDSELFGGSNMGNGGLVSSRPIPKHDRPFSIVVTLPPLGLVVFRWR
jgi:1,4-alpha-glucan branching enzyme